MPKKLLLEINVNNVLTGFSNKNKNASVNQGNRVARQGQQTCGGAFQERRRKT